MVQYNIHKVLIMSISYSFFLLFATMKRHAPSFIYGTHEQVNETCELPFSVDTWTLDLRRQTSSLRKPQNQIPSTSLSTTAGISSFENIESVCPNNAGNIQRGHNPAQSQSKASGLRMPTPSLGFFCPVVHCYSRILNV